MRIASLSLAFLATLGACVGTGTTDLTSTGSAFYTIVVTPKDSSSFPAGSVVLVQTHITHDGAVVASPSLTYTVLAGHGLLSAHTSVGDTLGVTSVEWTLGDTAGINTLVIATIAGADTLHVHGVIGAATVLTAVSADSVIVSANAPVSLQVRAFDRAGNAVPNTTIGWSTTGGTLSAASTPTDATGLAQVTLTAPSVSGAYFVTATLAGQATRVFEVVVH